MSFRACAYGRTWRCVIGVLLAISRLNLLLLAAAVLLADQPAVTPQVLVATFFWLTVVPEAAAQSIRRICRARVEVDNETLVIHRGKLTVEIPHTALSGVGPWRLPIPGSGLGLALRSGRRFSLQIESAATAEIVARLATCGAAAARGVGNHPILLFASAREPWLRQHWLERFAKFVVFAILPAAALFYAHQYATEEQPHILGLRAYLMTAAIYWSVAVIYLVLYASVLRAVGELIGLALAWMLPRQCVAVRAGVEWTGRVAYYGGVPLLLALRFWSS